MKFDFEESNESNALINTSGCFWNFLQELQKQLAAELSHLSADLAEAQPDNYRCLGFLFQEHITTKHIFPGGVFQNARAMFRNV